MARTAKTTKVFKLSASVRGWLLRSAYKLDDGRQLIGFGRYLSRYRSLQAFHNKKVGVVVKRHSCILDIRTPLKFRVPTVKLGGGWVAQPIVEKTRLRLALATLRKKLKPHIKRGIFPDLHTGNVGWYKGKPVMFDW